MTALTEALSDAIGRGVFASRPTAGIAGRLYISYDTSAVYRDNGTTWDLIATGASLTVEEVDASPTDSAVTKVVFPNGTLSIVGHVATYTPTANGVTVAEADGSPSTAGITTLTFPNDSVSIVGSVATIRQVPTGFIGAKAYHSSSQSVSANAVVLFNSEEFDTDNFHDTGSNTSRMTIPAGMGGKYTLAAGGFSSASNRLWFRKNGSTIIRSQGGPSGQNNYANVIAELVAGDYVEVVSNASVTFGASADPANEAWFSITKLDSGKVGGGIGASVYMASAQVVSAATETTALFSNEFFDTDGFHDTGSNTGRLTVPTGLAGKYLVTGNLYFSGTPGNTYIQIRKNGTTYASYTQAGNSGAGVALPTQAVLDLAAADYVELRGYRASGTAMDATNGIGSFSIMRLDSGSQPVLGAGKATRTAGDLTTTSTTFVDVTSLSVTITTGARRCLVGFIGNVYHSSNNAYVAVDIDIDGVRQGGTFGLAYQYTVTGGGTAHSNAFTYMTDVLTAGSHTFKAQWRVGAGTGNLIASSGQPAILWVQEQA